MWFDHVFLVQYVIDKREAIGVHVFVLCLFPHFFKWLQKSLPLGWKFIGIGIVFLAKRQVDEMMDILGGSDLQGMWPIKTNASDGDWKLLGAAL